jgi:endonuclease YncB( thermonuclease family)
MEKFATISGFGGVPSARANIGRLLAKILAEQETSENASPVKDTEDGDTIAVTPAGKKKAGGRKRKTGESADKVRIAGGEVQD